MNWFYRVLIYIFFIMCSASCTPVKKASADVQPRFRVNFSTLSQFGVFKEFTVLSSGELFFAKPENSQISEDYVTASPKSLADLVGAVSSIPKEIPNDVQLKILSACQDGNQLRVIIQGENGLIIVLIIPMSETCYSRSKMSSWIKKFLYVHDALFLELRK